MAECRPADAEIPPDELLFRAVELRLCIDGDELPWQCIDLPASSVVRSRYRGPTPPVQPKKPEYRRTAEIRVSELPPIMLHFGVPWGWAAVDCPEPDDDAHAEIWSLRMIDPEPRKAAKPQSKATKLALRVQLATAFRLHRSL